MSDCNCAECAYLCKRNPGWFTPEEARAAIAAGLGPKLMLDYYTGPQNIYILAPAAAGCEGDRAPNTSELCPTFFLMLPKGRCVFHTSDNLCSIHDSGFKPFQCRESFGCHKPDEPAENSDIMKLWDNDDARALIAEWMSLVGLDQGTLKECF